MMRARKYPAPAWSYNVIVTLLCAIALALAILLTVTRGAGGQSVRTNTALVACPPDSVAPIMEPATRLPTELASVGTTRFSFIMYGDTRGRHDGTEIQAEHELVMESMLATIKKRAGGPEAIRFVLQSGDAVINGRVASQWNVSYAPIINRLTAGANVPYLLAVGNHDVTSVANRDDPGRQTGLCHYLAANARLIPGEGSPRRLTGYPTYAFGYGNSFFIAFDSNIAGDTAQAAWVEQQIAGLDRRRYVNVIVFMHHPPLSSGSHGGAVIEPQAAAIRALYMPMFHKYHVRLLLTGHEHLFEHWVERYQDSSGAHRLDEIVSGGGGAPLTIYRGEPDLHAYLDAGSAIHLAADHLVKPSPAPGGNPCHYVVINVRGDQFDVEVIGVDWGKGFAPYTSATAVLTDRPPPMP